MQIIVQNLATEYRDEGTGKVILFLHGWQDSLHTFDPLVPLLSASQRIVRLDLPGFGGSENPNESWDLDKYVQFVLNFIQKLNLSVDTLVGHSFGGRIIIKGVASKDLQLNSIILIGAAGIAKNRTARNTAIKFLAKIGGRIISIFPLVFLRDKIRKKMYRSIGSDYLDAGALKESFLNIIAEDLCESAKKISLPTLLIWGADDTQTPISDGEQFSRLIVHSRLNIINGAGHFIHREKPHEVARLIQEFV